MPSEHPFDSKLKQQFEQFQPDVEGDWNAFEKRMNAANASGSRVDVPTLNRWAVATAVAAGSALMWVAKPAVDALVEDETLESSAAVPEKDQAPAISFDDAWEAYSAVKSVDESSAESSSDAISEVALTNAEPVSPSPKATLSTEHVMDNEVAEEAPNGGLDVEESTVSVEEHALTIEEILETLPFKASVNRACEGVEVAFELSGMERQMNFLWNFGDGHFSSEPTPTHTFDEPGTYDVTLSVRPSGEGSINTRTIQNMITVLPKPEADFAWAFPATSDGKTVEVQLKQATEDVASTSWTLDGEVTNVGAFELVVPGVYEVTFEATNEYGCFDEVKKDIHVGDMNGLLALSRFSPNGDGRYDSFMPHGLAELTEAWELVISDLSGKEVYRTSELTQPWDGTLVTGEPAPARSEFIWTVRCVDAEGGTRLFTDKVMLER